MNDSAIKIESIDDLARYYSKPDEFLLVDDDVATCEIFQRLTKNFSINWTVVHTGEDALALIEKNKYRVVVLDYVLPGMPAVEIFKAIKRNNPLQSVLICSGYINAVNFHEMTPFGYPLWVEKPACFTREYFDQVLSVLSSRGLVVPGAVCQQTEK